MKLTRLFNKPLLESRFEKSCIDCPPSFLDIQNLTYWWEMRSVFNAGAILRNNAFNLLYRAQDYHFISRLGLAIFDPEKKKIVKRPDMPFFELSSPNELQFGRVGCEDPRIMYQEGEKEYLITYVSASLKQMTKRNLEDLKKTRPYGWYDVYTRVMVSSDLASFQDCGLIFNKSELKDVALFPKKYNGYYVFLLRYPPSIQLAFTRNLVEIEKVKDLITPRSNFWDNEKVGIGPPPIYTPKGWLCIYHGVDSKKYYRLGYFILDLLDPSKVLFRSKDPILEPDLPWERVGNVPDVVFSNGAGIYKDTLYVFYGAADTRIGVATAKVSDFFKF